MKTARLSDLIRGALWLCLISVPLGLTAQKSGGPQPGIRVEKTFVLPQTPDFAVMPTIELQQYHNGPFSAPVNTGTNWVADNAGLQNAHYSEGWSIPYRCVMTGLPANTMVTLTIGYDVKNTGRHAIDYLTHYHRLEPHNFCTHNLAEDVLPTAGVSGITGPPTSFPVPEPSSGTSPVPGEPGASFNTIPAGERQMVLFGATLTGVTYNAQGDLTAGQSETTIDVSFHTEDGGTVVLAWGGHIASRLDWGVTNNGFPLSAGGLNGAPYHMRLKNWTLGAAGLQDRSLSGLAVAPAGEIIGTNPVCAGTPQQYCLKSPQSGEIYQWSVSGNAAISGSSTKSCVDILAGSAGSFTLTLMVTQPAGGNICVEFSTTITVQGGQLACVVNGPAAVCPALPVSYCGPPGANAYAWSVSGAGSIDGPNTTPCITALPTNNCAGSFTPTLTITDNFGCKSTCNSIVTVADNLAPTFTAVPKNVTVSCYSVPPPGIATATDNCAGAVAIAFTGQTRTDGNCPQNYTLTRQWTATDNCGNPKTATQLITVRDTQGPQMLSAPQDAIVECDLLTSASDYQAWLDNHGGATAQDCGAITWTYGDDPGHYCPTPCGGTFFKPILFTATDACGNSTTANAIFWNIDETPPTFTTPPQNKSVDCMAGCDGEAELLEWLDNLAGLEVADNCGDVQVDYIFGPDKDQCGNTWSRTYHFRATDQCGNRSTAYATFSIIDTIPPTIEFCPPSNYFLTCKGDIPLPNPGAVIATDNCGDVTVFVKPPLITGDGCPYWPMSVSYWYVAVDKCGNMAVCDQSFIAQDNIPPVITCPPGIIVECEANIPDCPANLAAFYALPGASAADNCDATPGYSCDTGPLTGGACGGTVIRTFGVMDDCGNMATCSQVITVDDNTPPVVVPGAIAPCYPTVAEAEAAASAATNATDNCPSLLTMTVNTSGTCSAVITVSFTDACGNASFTTYNTRIDNTPPAITCPPNLNLGCNAAVPAPDIATVTVSDNCPGAITAVHLGDTPPILDPDCLETRTRTYQATDGCGNTASCIQTITRKVDTAPPAIACPPNLALTCNAAIPAPDITTVTVSDNCPGAITAVHLGDSPPVIDPVSCIEIRTRTYRATDACGNTMTCAQTIGRRVDTTPPTVTCPPNLNLGCNAAIPAADIASVVVSDNCPGAITAVHLGDTPPAIDPATCMETRTRTYQATDACGNTASCQQTITRTVDTTPPTIACPPNLTLACNAAIPAPDIATVVVSDNCPGAITVVHLGDSPPVIDPATCMETRTRTYRATDTCGNTALCAQTITRKVDTTPPATTCPPDVILGCNGPIPPPDILTVVVNDNCPGAIVVIFLGDTPPLFDAATCMETRTRTYRATDDCANTMTCKQTITRKLDMTPPTITCPANETVECAGAVPPCPASLADFLLLPGAGATDNCDLDPGSLTCTDGPVMGNPCSGSMTRIYSIKDDCGNIDDCIQIFFLIDNVPPNLVCPDSIILCVEDMTDPCTTGFPNNLKICSDIFPICPAPPALPEYLQSKLCPHPNGCVVCPTMWFLVPRGNGTPVMDVCSDVKLTYCDPDNSIPTCVFIPGAAPPYLLFTRTWIAYDECGNRSECKQKIYCDPTCHHKDPSSDFSIFPNPTYDAFTVRFEEHCIGMSVSIEVFNHLG
ncbi:MAG: hypothetical protein IPH12_21715 [Saprospirales bacterium]|nr:hypothetical protein [Saprospirales bacterium]